MYQDPYAEFQDAPPLRGPPRRAVPQNPEQAARDVAGTRASNADANRTQALTPAQVRNTDLQNQALERQLRRPPNVTDSDISGARSRLSDARALSRLVDDYERQFEGYEGRLTAGEWSPLNIIGVRTQGMSNLENAANAMIPIIRRMQRTPGDPLAQAETAAFGEWIPSLGSYDTTNRDKVTRLREYIGQIEQEAERIVPDYQPPPSRESSQVSGEGPINPINPGGRNVLSADGGDVQTQADLDNATLYARQVTARLRRGDSIEQLDAFARGAGQPPIDPRFHSTIRRYRQRGRGRQLEYQPNVVPPTGRSEPSAMSGFTASGPGALAAAHLNAVTGDRLDNIAGALGHDPELAQQAIESARENHPEWSLAGDVSGTVAAYTGGGRMLRHLPGVNRIGRAARMVGGDALYGGYRASGQGDGWFDPSKVPVGAAIGVGAGIAGRGLVRGAGAAARGVGNVNTRFLNSEGVPLTVGQIARAGGSLPGRMIGGIEERLAGAPLVGDMISAARNRGTEGFNRAAFRQGTGRPNPAIGQAGVEQAQRGVTVSYDNALNGVTVSMNDPQLIAQLGAVRQSLSQIPIHGPRAVQEMDYTLGSLVDDAGNLTGRNLQAARQYLAQSRSSPIPSTEPQALAGALRDAYSQADDALVTAVTRQSPATIPALNAANEANRSAGILGSAVGAAKNRPGDLNEIFTPAQLGAADFNATVNYGGRRAAQAGRSPYRRLAASGSRVMGNQIPDSGTAGRAMLMGAPVLVGAGAGYAAGGGSPEGVGIGGGAGALSALATIAALYSKTGQRGVQAALLGRGPRAREIGRLINEGRIPGINRTAPQLGGMGMQSQGAQLYENPENPLYDDDWLLNDRDLLKYVQPPRR